MWSRPTCICLYASVRGFILRRVLLERKGFKGRALLMSVKCCDSQRGLPLCLPSGLSLLIHLLFFLFFFSNSISMFYPPKCLPIFVSCLFPLYLCLFFFSPSPLSNTFYSLIITSVRTSSSQFCHFNLWNKLKMIYEKYLPLDILNCLMLFSSLYIRLVSLAFVFYCFRWNDCSSASDFREFMFSLNVIRCDPLLPQICKIRPYRSWSNWDTGSVNHKPAQMFP